MSCILYRKEHVNSGLIHPNGKMIALLVSSNINTIELYRFDDVKKPIKLIWSYQLKDKSKSLCWCNDNKCICIGDINGTITIIDINGTVKICSPLHNRFNEIVDIKSLTLNQVYSNLSNIKIYPKNLMEFVNIEPYILSIRDYNNMDIFNLLNENQHISNINTNTNNLRTLNAENMNLLNLDILDMTFNLSQDDSSNINYVECPKILPEFTNYENISLLLTMDSDNNIICSIGGHTPIWMHNINRLNDGKKTKLLKINFKKNYIFLIYTMDEFDLCCEIIDLKEFIISFDVILYTFGYLQYIRQLLNYLKCVFQQINLVWKTGIKPFRQLINNEKIIKKDHLSVFLNSIILGVPINMFLTKDMYLSDISITIDQLVMIGQNINDSIIYINSITSRTILPIMKHISIIWNIIKETGIVRSTDIKFVNNSISELEDFLESFDNEIKQINPIIHTFLHLLSIIKTYRDDVKKTTVDCLSPPKIILSNNSNIISDTFNININNYYVLKEFVEKKNLLYKINENEMQDKELINSFIDSLEFKNIDQLLNEDFENSIGSIFRLNINIDQLYKLTVRKVTEDYINNFLDLKIKLNSQIFSSKKINNSFNITFDNDNIILNFINSLHFDQNQYIFTRIKILNDCNLDQMHQLNTFTQDLNPDIIVECKSKIYSFNINNILVFNSIFSPPKNLIHYDILDITWTNSHEMLLLFNKQKSSFLFNFNLNLLKFQNLNPIKKSCKNSTLIDNHSQNLYTYYFYINNKIEVDHFTRFNSIISSNYNLSNLYHCIQDISRIHRPQKFRNIKLNVDNGDINQSENSISKTEIISFYSENNQVSLIFYF